MKKLSYLILGAAALTMASCSQDDLLNDGKGNGNYNVTVKLPADLATRALSDGLTADDLQIAVYDADNDNSLVFTADASFNKSLETTVSLNLSQGKTYNIAFFAVSEAGSKVYKMDAKNHLFTVDYDAYDSAENLEDAYDCFYWLEPTGVIGQVATNKTVTLYRPVAQINWGANDLGNDAIKDENAFGEDGKYIVTNLQISNAFTEFDLIKGDVSGAPSEVTISALASPASGLLTDPEGESATWMFPVEGYEYVAMQYVLAPKGADVYDLTLNINNEGNPDSKDISVNDIVVSSAPVQANYRTNIYGTLLTDNMNYKVVKDPNWFKPDYDVTMDTQAFLTALKTGGNITLSGDVYLPQRVNITKDANINFNGYTIYGPATGDGALLVNGSKVTFEGNGGIALEGDGTYIAVWVIGGGEATINGGNYSSTKPIGELFYISNGGGTININGGSFKGGSSENGLLNCQDGEYNAGTAKFVVKGGVFYGNFNPAASMVEPVKPVSWVPAGYQSVQMTINGENAYVVVPEGYKPVIQEDQDAITAGGKIALAEDFDYTSGRITITKTTELDLNGFTLTSAGSAYGDVLANGANLTIKNGTIAPGPNTNELGGNLIYHIPSGATTLTLENVTAIGGAYPVFLKSTNMGSAIVINSGTYASAFDNGPAVYVQTGGSVTINGGTFGLPGVNNGFLLNIKDDFRAPTTERQPNEIIVVKGGTFINFNPANNKAEGEGTNFVADGYKVVSQQIGTDTFYTVVPE